ncbi:hypothetical protein JL2886_01483 [Phaeobacter gallaeciensis]|uniref:Uncharacterized protein n=1 Tax=Phaeobacter gallaeciensis TaxID=60890 RepID=A0A1B0ZQH4_9RHOB|nr:hypothetical protein JL2886_01483 [Phaeobacter gallaeciensis]
MALFATPNSGPTHPQKTNAARSFRPLERAAFVRSRRLMARLWKSFHRPGLP